MPELPEVEVVRRGLRSQVQGSVLRKAVVRDRRLRWPIPEEFEERLIGQRLGAVGRRGKYLLLEFERGTLISHLGMSGNWRFLDADTQAEAHDHVDLVFENGCLRYHDPRRFGSIHGHAHSSGPVGAHALLAKLGLEPLDGAFEGAVLHRASRGRKVSIKQFLLAGHCVVGVGNIYACESLFRAGIRPGVAAGRLSHVRCDALANEIVAVLNEAIDRGGSTLRDFVSSDGERGYFQSQALVYGRAGQPCVRCGAPVVVTRQQQRSTYFCRSCQV